MVCAHEEGRKTVTAAMCRRCVTLIRRCAPPSRHYPTVHCTHAARRRDALLRGQRLRGQRLRGQRFEVGRAPGHIRRFHGRVTAQW